MAFENFNATFSSSDEQKKKKEGGDTIKVASGDRFGGFNSEFDVANPSRIKNPAQTQGELPDTSPVEDTSIFHRVVDAGKSVIKKGLDAWNYLQQSNAEADLKSINILYRAGKPDYATIEEARADAPLVKMFNSNTGRAVIGTVAEGTSNWGIKGLARLRALGDESYEEAFRAWKTEREDPENPTWQKFLYELQDSGTQSALGMLLTYGTSIAVGLATRNPAAGQATGLSISSAYYTALSANEQLEERGKVDSLGNIAIDVVGDQVINTLLLGIFKAPASSLTKASLQGFGVEGGTEVTQTLLKYANDYGKATDEEAKNKILREANQYVASGAMMMEFGVGGVMGGVATGLNYKYGGENGAQTDGETETSPNLDSNYIPKKDEDKKEESVTWRGSELSFDSEAIKNYRDEVSTMEETGDITSQRYRDLQDFFTDYSSAFYDKTAYVPSSNTGAPLLEVVTIPFPDGKVAVRYGANTPFNSVNVGYNYGKLYGTKEEATQAALTDIQNWATEQRANAQDVKAQASYDRILRSAKNPQGEATSLIASEVEKQKKQELTRRRKEFIQQRDEQMEALGAGNLSGSQKTQLAFERSAGQTRVGTMGETQVVIGSYGMNAIDRKTKNGQDDRVSADELPDALKNVKRTYRAGDSGFRTDNVVAIAENEDGSRMAIILRKNAKGQEEVINFFKIGRDADVFEENLKQFGAPERDRTSIASLEPTSPNPLEDKGSKSVAKDATAVKGITSPVSPKSPKYQRINQNVKEAGGYISNEEAEKIVWSLFSPTELNVNFVNRLTTDKGNGAWGMWWDNAITMVRNPHWSTPYHESTHAYIGMFMEKGEKKTLYDAIRKTDGKEYTDREAEEAIADGFVDYVRETRTFTGKLKDFFERVKTWIREQFPQLSITPQPVTDLYRNMISRKRPDTETVQESRVISTDMVEVSMAYQDAKDFTVKFLSSPMLQGRPKFSAQYVKDSVRSGKFPINEKEQRFVNEVIDAHFAGKKDITMEELTSAIEGDMLPMQVVETSKWSNYGVDEAQVGSDFSNEIRTTKTFVVGAGRDVEPFMDYNGRSHGFEKEVSGFMFHFRVAVTEDGGDIYNVIEVQSDPFQKDLFADDKGAREKIGMVQTHLPVGKMNDVVNKVLNQENDAVMPFAFKATSALRSANDELVGLKESIRKVKEDLKKAQTVFDELKAGKLQHANKGHEESLPIEKLKSRLKDGIIKKHNLGSELGMWWGFRTGSRFGYGENEVFRTQADLADIMENGLEKTSWKDASAEWKENNPDERYEIEPFFEFAQKKLGEYESQVSVAKTTIDTSMELLEGYANGELTIAEKNQYASFQKFKGYKDRWYELATRVAIHVAARDGAVKVRFPSAYTMTRIESWDSQSLDENGGGYDRYEAERADVGGTVTVYGEDVYVTANYGDGRFEGTEERPDTEGNVDDVKESEEQNLRDDWEGMLRDDIEMALVANREEEVGFITATIGAKIQVQEDYKAENEQKVKESEAEVEIIKRDGAYIGRHDKNHQITDIANAFEDIAEGGRYNTSSFRLYSEFSSIFAGMTINPDTPKAEVLQNLLQYEARRYTDNDKSFITKLLLSGSESEVQTLYDRMDSGEVQIEVVSFVADEGKKKDAQQRLADYGEAVGADTVRSMMGSSEGDGTINNFYGIIIKNERVKETPNIRDKNFFTEVPSRSKVPALIEKQVAEYQSDAQKYRERIGHDEMAIADFKKKQKEVEKWLEKGGEEKEQKFILNVYKDGEQVSVYHDETPDSRIYGAYGNVGVEIRREVFTGTPYAYNTWTKKPEYTSFNEQKVRDFVAQNPEKYVYRENVEADDDYKMSESEIVDNLNMQNSVDEAYIERFIEAKMNDFDAKDWVEGVYGHVFWNENEDYYIAYDREPDTRSYEPSDYDSADEQIDSMRNDFEQSTDLTKKGNWFGSLDDTYQGAAYRYEVDIPRYLKKYRKENVEAENAFGFTWTSYDISEEDQGGIPLYQNRLQGMDLTESEALAYVSGYIKDLENDYELEGLDFSIVEMRVVGSRTAGRAKKRSDLDILLEYKGTSREDDMFNALNRNPLKIDGVRIDINPIRKEQTGTMGEVYKNPNEFYGETPMYQTMPVEVEGKVRQSRAYQRVFDRLTQATEGDANYNQMSIAKDTASALAFVKSNPEGASKVALGVLPPPEGITETAISIAVAEQAASQDNFELQAEVERSRSLRQTRRGQEIVAEKGRFNQNSPSHFIGQVLDARLEHLRGSYPRFALKNSARKDASAIIDAETVTLRKKMKKQQEKTQLAQQVIDLLTC